MHPVRHRTVLGPAHRWGLVWLVALAVPMATAPLRTPSERELGLLELAPPRWPEMPIGQLDEPVDDEPLRRERLGRDPFTAPVAAPTAVPAPMCGVSSLHP